MVERPSTLRRRANIQTYLKLHASFDEIAEILSIPRSLVMREAMLFERQSEETAWDLCERYRLIHLHRYEDLLAIAWAGLYVEDDEGNRVADRSALRDILAIMAAQRELMGADSPKRFEHKHDVDARVDVMTRVRELEKNSLDHLTMAENILAKIIESGEDVTEAEIIGLLESGESRT